MYKIQVEKPAGATDVRLPVNTVLEIVFGLPGLPSKPFLSVDVDCRIKAADGTVTVIPAFWKGEDTWAFRFASSSTGGFSYAIAPVALPDGSSAVFHIAGSFEVVESVSENPFMKHGPVCMAEGNRYLQHTDGTPFFVLADSWWHGMSARLPFEDFCFLVKDRRGKGFNSIQFAITNPCDVGEFDPRVANEGGHPWLPEYADINPEYFDFTDRRFMHLIEQGFLPGMVGTWGYYIGFMGIENTKKLWRYLYARYAAFPCILVLCGESKLPWYQSKNWGADGSRQAEQWTEVIRSLRNLNTFGRPVAIHPGPDIWNQDASYPPLTDMELVDFYYGMGGHGAVNEWENLSVCINNMNDYRASFPGRAAMVGECLFEGMMGGGCGPKMQRALFWLSVLNGAPGHCYGADALWQMNSRNDLFGDTTSLGRAWGNFPWEEACHWGGSTMVAVGKKIIECFEWWRFERHPEWVDPAVETEKGYGHVAAAAGIPGELRLIYISRRGMKTTLKHLDPSVNYKVSYIDPLTGNNYPCHTECRPDANGNWVYPQGPISQDWLLLIEESQ